MEIFLDMLDGFYVNNIFYFAWNKIPKIDKFEILN